MTPCTRKWANAASAHCDSAPEATYLTMPPGRCGAFAASGFPRRTPDFSGHSRERCHPAPPRIGIASLVQDLPERYRLPLILRYLKGLSPEQIAATLGRSVEATRLDLNHAVNALRESLSSSWRARARTR